jgi:hypothetical protein
MSFAYDVLAAKTACSCCDAQRATRGLPENPIVAIHALGDSRRWGLLMASCCTGHFTRPFF